MADPQAALLTQLRHIQAKTGKTLAELHAAVAASGRVKHGEKRSFVMEHFQLGYGDANTVVHTMGQPPAGLDAGPTDAGTAPPDSGVDPLDAIYGGAKAHLRALHDHVIAAIDAFGTYETAPKKSYVSLRRRKQFAMVGPATREAIEIGLNAKALPPHARLKAMPPGGMCPYSTRLSRPEEIDADLRAWLRAAFDAAG